MASEVKALAEQTTKLTETINARIVNFKSLVQDAGQATQSVAGAMMQIDQASSESASAVEQQTAAVSEISRSAQTAAERTGLVDEETSTVMKGAEASVPMRIRSPSFARNWKATPPACRRRSTTSCFQSERPKHKTVQTYRLLPSVRPHTF
ncbi:MAG: methyl-accepting chemotaxis protein [Oceanicaulis sp.]|nr:methyl-accepting chemotaxis protein [Oceanicaulis sp.]